MVDPRTNSPLDLVVKLVGFIGVPKHTEFTQEDLYQLEWNEQLE